MLIGEIDLTGEIYLAGEIRVTVAICVMVETFTGESYLVTSTCAGITLVIVEQINDDLIETLLSYKIFSDVVKLLIYDLDTSSEFFVLLFSS